MAQARTRLWFLPTSPRNPDKIRPELTILQAFEGSLWDRKAQAAFFQRIVSAGLYESAARPRKEPDQPGRERVHRAPRALGFARAKTGATLEITKAGHALIDGEDPADLFLHQLLKLQFPSPNHHERDYRELFRIKPFLEVLRLVSDFNSISKFELQAFALGMRDHRQFDEISNALYAFREERSRVAPGRAQREFERSVLATRLRAVYADDLAIEGISLRERQGRTVSPDDVLKTKVDNARDYADAAMRYFQRTGLFTFSDFGTLRLLPERAPDVHRILASVSPEPEPYDMDDLGSFWHYLGNPDVPRLPLDERVVVEQRLAVLEHDVTTSVRDAAGALPAPTVASILELERAFSQLLQRAEAEARNELRTRLARQDVITDLVDVFRQVAAGGMIDRSLVLEWNTWRALAVLDDGDVRNNFKLDRFGQPLSHAPGKVPDIECTYTDFHLLTEVTVSTGARQHATEGEPVTRHVGLYQRRMQDSGDRHPVYGLFIAERLNPTVIADFYSSFTTKVREFGGAVKIVPLEITDFVALLEATRPRLHEFRAEDLRQFLERASLLVTECMDEGEWWQRVRELAALGL